MSTMTRAITDRFLAAGVPVSGYVGGAVTRFCRGGKDALRSIVCPFCGGRARGNAKTPEWAGLFRSGPLGGPV
jgi:hypothetical protein